MKVDTLNRPRRTDPAMISDLLDLQCQGKNQSLASRTLNRSMQAECVCVVLFRFKDTYGIYSCIFTIIRLVTKHKKTY